MNEDKKELLRVSVYDDKYTVVLEEDGRLYALRYGERWRDLVGDKLVLSLAQEIEHLRKELNEFRYIVNE